MKVVLVGGLAHGRVVFTNQLVSKLSVLSPDEMVSGSESFNAVDEYIGRKYLSAWPIPGWDFNVNDTFDYSRGDYERYAPYWSTRIWATSGRHKLINQFFENEFSSAVNMVLHELSVFGAATTAPVDAVMPKLLELIGGRL